MRNPLTLIGALGLAVLAGCTVKSTEAPSLAGPSTFATAITLRAEPDSIYFDPFTGSTITVEARNEKGQPIALNMRAEIRVGGIVQDYGTLSTKLVQTSPTTGQSRITYFPPAAPTSGTVTTQTVSIAVTPIGTDAGSETTRTVDIQLVPVGTIAPRNPDLVASFTVSPASPSAFTTVSFDASASTNKGVVCGTLCGYNWNFGDGTTGTGIKATKEYRSGGSKTVTLTVNDAFGATATAIQTVTVANAVAPTVSFVTSPSGTVGINQDIFFNASASTPAAGRTIVTYAWDFGDGETAGGVTTSHRFRAVGSYQVQLSATDDVGTVGKASPASITVTAGGPTVSATAQPSSQLRNQPIVFNVTATPASGSVISSYRFSYGDGTSDTGTASTQTHSYGTTGTFPVAITVTDSLGRATTITLTVTIT